MGAWQCVAKPQLSPPTATEEGDVSRQDVSRIVELTMLGALLALNLAQVWTIGIRENLLSFALPGALLGLLFAIVTRRRV